MKKQLFLISVVLFLSSGGLRSENILWKLGENDNNAKEFALGPDQYKRFLEKDFGYEDRYFLIGRSNIATDFAYIMPGPNDSWGGTWGTSGWRTHEANILFGLDNIPANNKWKLVVDVLDNQKAGALVKITVNNKSKKFKLGGGGSDSSAVGKIEKAKESLLEMELASEDFKIGGNLVGITILEGSWIIFDQVRLEGPDQAVLKNYDSVFVRGVEAAGYEIRDNGRSFQPLLVDVEHLDGQPRLSVLLDNKKIFESVLDTSRYIYEAPMPAVRQETQSTYKLLVDGRLIEEGRIVRNKQRTNISRLCRYKNRNRTLPLDDRARPVDAF